MSAAEIPSHISVVDFKISAHADGSPAIALIYFNSIADPYTSQQSEITFALLRDTLAVLSQTSDPLERNAIVDSYFLQLATLKARLSIKGPNSANQVTASFESRWVAAEGVKMFANSDSTNFADLVRAGVILKGWEDPVLVGPNNTI